nr:lytic transglycosylase domain-containing protein [Actinoplanes subtropicus]
MSRPWSRVGVRSASVGLLVAGLIGGVYLGKDRVVQAPQQHSEASNVVQVDVLDMQLLKQRQAQHAAARAFQREAEGDAAEKAAAEAKDAAGKAHALETKAIAAKAAADAAKKKADASSSSSSGGPVAYTGPIPDSCNDYSGARQTGCALMLAAGYKIDQFPCLDKLWTRESGWNYKSTNSSSGAYGVPQAVPGKKMAAFGSDWKTNPATQIKWGLDYIKNRYSTPCGAWSHSESTGWY